MTPAELEKQLLSWAAGPAAEEAQVRALCEGLAEHGAPPACAVAAHRLVFDRLAWIQDHLGAAQVARLEALLEEPAGAQRVPESLDARILEAVRREAPLPPPVPPPAIQRWSLGVPLVMAMGLAVFTVMTVAMNATGTQTHGLIGRPGGIEVRIDHRDAIYRPGEKIFVQLAASGSGHLSLVAVTASGQAGLIVAEQPVRAGQVVMARATAGATAGRARLLALIASRPLGDLAPLVERLAQPVEVSKIMESFRAHAAARGASVEFGTAELEVRPEGR